jgi:Family of unknown function (DUF6941)
VNVTMLLCDSVAEADGKLYILGGGWSRLNIPDSPVPMGLAVKIGVPWDQTNHPHMIRAKLMTADGEQVEIEGEPIEAGGEAEVGRPAGVKPGTDIDLPLAIQFNGIRLPAGGYRWELEIDGVVEAQVPFQVVAPRPI